MEFKLCQKHRYLFGCVAIVAHCNITVPWDTEERKLSSKKNGHRKTLSE